MSLPLQPRSSAALAAVLLVLVLPGPASPARADEAPVHAEPLSPVLLRLGDGRTLRLAGLEGALPEHEELRAAAMRALAGLVEGEALRLEPEEPPQDRLGRELVQAFRRSDGLWLQGRLLRWGHARVDPFTAPFENLQEFLLLEEAAREEAAGLWSHPAYRLRGSAPDELLPWIGSLQVFEGRVEAAGGGRGDLYLNFGEDWKSDTTARVSGRLRKRFEEAGLDLEGLAGRRVRLRGWLHDWNGPFLELHSPAQIEILESEPPPPG